MNIAAILALLLSSGACAKSEFHAADGGALQVVVCPMMAPAVPHDATEPPPPGEAPKAERHA